MNKQKINRLKKYHVFQCGTKRHTRKGVHKPDRGGGGMLNPVRAKICFCTIMLWLKLHHKYPLKCRTGKEILSL